MQHLSNNLEALRKIEKYSNLGRQEKERARLLTEIESMIIRLAKPLPWIGRVLTIKKFYGGVIKNLRLNPDTGFLEVIIHNGAKHHFEVPLCELQDIQEFQTIDGRPLSLSIGERNHKEVKHAK